MKTITTIALAILIVLAGCKKDDQEPTPAPIHMINYFTLNGTEVPINNNDTAIYWVSSNATTVACGDNYPFFSVVFPGSDTTTYHIQTNGVSPYMFVVGLAGSGYSHPDVWVHVTRYDSIGGRIVGTFSGTVKQNSDTTVILPVSGAFDVLRGPDIQ